MSTPYCELMQDLIPLCHDGVAGAESRRLVNEHLQNCVECRALYDALGTPPPDPDDPIAPLKSLRKRYRRRVFLWIAAALLIAAVVLLGGWMTYKTLFERSDFAFPPNRIETTVSQFDDGGLYLDVTLRDTKAGPCGWRIKSMEDGAWLLTPYCSWAVQKGLFRETSAFSVLFVNALQEPGYEYLFPIEAYLPAVYVDRLDFTELRVGVETQYETVWRAGDDVPAVSDELAALYQTYLDSRVETPWNVSGWTVGKTE